MFQRFQSMVNWFKGWNHGGKSWQRQPRSKEQGMSPMERGRGQGQGGTLPVYIPSDLLLHLCPLPDSAFICKCIVDWSTREGTTPVSIWTFWEILLVQMITCCILPFSCQKQSPFPSPLLQSLPISKITFLVPETQTPGELCSLFFPLQTCRIEGLYWLCPALD